MLELAGTPAAATEVPAAAWLSEELRFARDKAATTCRACDGAAAMTADRTSLIFTPGTFAAATAIPPAEFGSFAAAAAAAAGATTGTLSEIATTVADARSGLIDATA